MPASRLKVLAVALGAIVVPLAVGAALLRPAFGAGAAAAPAPAVGAILVRGPVVHSVGCEPQPSVEVLIDDDVIRVAVELYDIPHLDDAGRRHALGRYAIAPAMIARNNEAWDELRRVLTELKAADALVERSDIYVAVGGWRGAPVPYADLVRTLDVARQVGFDGPVVQPATTLQRSPPTWWRTGFPGPFLDICQSVPEHWPRDGLVAFSAAC